jgi:hypothetical protein
MVAGTIRLRLQIAIVHVRLQCGVQAGRRATGGVSEIMEASWWAKMDVGTMVI